MRIRKIELENFRTFRDFELNFDKDTTIIFAGSGKGKTTLKEAILMGLHANSVWNEVFDDVKKESDIKNLFTNGSIDELKVTKLSIKLELVDEEFEYFIEHSATFSSNKLNTKKYDALTQKYRFFDLNASKRPLVNAGQNIPMFYTDIEAIFPLDLAKILFFSGEIERLSESKDLKNTLYNLFDLTKYDKAKTVLRSIKKEYDNELGKISTGDLKKCVDDRLENNEKIDVLEKQIHDDRTKIEEKTNEVNDIIAEIERQQDAKKYSIEWQALVDKKDATHEFLKIEIKNQARKLIQKDQNSMYALGKNLQNIFNELNSDSEDKRFISGINQEAIEQILNDELCICGRHIDENMAEYLNKIKDLLPPNEIGTFKRDINKYLNSSFNEIELTEYDNYIFNLATLEDEIRRSSNLIKENIYNPSIEDTRNILNQEIGRLKGNVENNETRINKLIDSNNKIRKDEEKYRNDNQKALIIEEKILYVESLIEKCQFDYIHRQKEIIENIKLAFLKMLKDAEVYKEFKVGEVFDDKNLKLKIGSFSEGQKTMLNTFFMLSVLNVSLANNIKLPAILDGFISKQGLELTNKTMSVIKKQENQLILFTLDKDKQHVEMDKNIASYYELKREANDEFSRIEEC